MHLQFLLYLLLSFSSFSFPSPPPRCCSLIIISFFTFSFPQIHFLFTLLQFTLYFLRLPLFLISFFILSSSFPSLLLFTFTLLIHSLPPYFIVYFLFFFPYLLYFLPQLLISFPLPLGYHTITSHLKKALFNFNIVLLSIKMKVLSVYNMYNKTLF